MNPSLLLIPDRYKASKLYSQIPDSGAGDLAFTRANDTATRVNSAGLIEKVRTNINTYSEQLDDAAWTKQSTTVTANATTAPNGTLTADKLIATATTAFHGIFNVNATLNSLHTFSFYAKKAEYNFVTALDQFSGRFIASFNLDTGAVSSGSGASIQFVGNGWYRCSIAFDGASSAVVATLAPSPSNASVNYLGDGTSGVFLWGAQLETGDIATPYIPTTTAAVSVGPVADIPRIDYTGGGCGKLLLEPQRTNLVLFSEQLDNAAWTKVQSSVTANNAASPDGFINADKFIANTTSNLHFANSSIANVAAPWTYSVFAKAAGYDRLIMWVAGTNFVGFNLTTGVVESTLGTGITSANIQNYGNGWYRCSITSTSTSSGTSVAFAVFNAAFTNGNSNPIFTGNGTDGILIYGAQFEAGSYVSSYIPTLGASVTRSADAASKTGISSLIGQTSGSVFLDIDLGNAPIDNSYIMLRNASVTDYIALRIFSGTLRFEVVDDSVLQVAIDRATITAGRVKIAMAYSLNDFVMYANGTQIGTDTSGTVPTCDILDLNFNAPTANAFSINTAATYTTRLSNSELATLTSL